MVCIGMTSSIFSCLRAIEPVGQECCSFQAYLFYKTISCVLEGGPRRVPAGTVTFFYQKHEK
ncbi:MAG: hypothetical protein C4576_14380 [Desulfobacteraceae bacterium]|nr:MAG: hypothetical protein C4576_14380 [Desulfobacteraceae bacterium]